MPLIQLDTKINAPIEPCFNLSLDVSVHTGSMKHTDEKIVGGRLSDICEAGDTITWEAVHFGTRQRLTVKVLSVDFPHFFEDMMLKGAFASMHHKHFFQEENGYTIMRDEFNYVSPLGVLGRLADRVFLEKYMRKLLMERNKFIKEAAENQAFGLEEGADD
ncbi:SRPBCC family protein [Pollutibacter soli]|uniref:SRPBCC family protein n=1 Tax=Pollutibacter soli TaxID=3034157 RepID=UPI003013ACA6